VDEEERKKKGGGREKGLFIFYDPILIPKNTRIGFPYRVMVYLKPQTDNN
jgi:hypothetical protein